MAACRSLALVLAVVTVLLITGGAAGSNKSLDITNNCAKTLWLFVSSRSGDSAAAPDNTGLPELAPGASLRMPLPSVWSGRIWGQTDCGGCSGASCHDCAGGNAAAAAPPATIALFSIGGNQCTDFYAVSLVQGYNLPMLVAPDGGCTPVACVADQINSECPAELRVMSAAGTGAVACKSACLAFGAPQDCCTGDNGRPDTCRPSTYSEFFKKACPQAITYAYDDAADSMFTCGAGAAINYTVTFCPAATTSSRSVNDDGNSQVGTASDPWNTSLIVAVLALVTAVISLLTAALGFFKKVCSS